MNEPNRVFGVIIVNDIPCPVTNMFDWTGEETDDIESAVTAVAQAPDGKWITFDAYKTGIGKLN